jgi:hypothetical protein
MTVPDLRDWVSIATSVLTVMGVIVGLRVAMAKLELTMGETTRLLVSLHKRMDEFGHRLARSEITQAVLSERIEHLRGGGRFAPPPTPVYPPSEG